MRRGRRAGRPKIVAGEDGRQRLGGRGRRKSAGLGFLVGRTTGGRKAAVRRGERLAEWEQGNMAIKADRRARALLQ